MNSVVLHAKVVLTKTSMIKSFNTSKAVFNQMCSYEWHALTLAYPRFLDLTPFAPWRTVPQYYRNGFYNGIPVSHVSKWKDPLTFSPKGVNRIISPF